MSGKGRLGLVVLLAVMGIFFYRFVYGFSFAGVLLWAAALLLVVIDGLLRLKAHRPRLAKGLLAALCVLCGAGILAAVVTGGWILENSHTDADPGNQYVILLGAGVNGSTPSRSLRERMNGAIAYLNQYPDAVCIVSGGQGSGEDITEAQCMATYLVEHGIDPTRIWQEPCATNTRENLELSLELIEKKTGQVPQSVTVITSEYHLLRAKRYGEACGVQTKGYAAKTEQLAYRVVALLREIPAVWKQLLGG